LSLSREMCGRTLTGMVLSVLHLDCTCGGSVFSVNVVAHRSLCDAVARVAEQ